MRLCAGGVSWLLLNEGNWGRLLTAKTRSASGASQQPAPWAVAWLLVTYGSTVYLVVDELRPCVLWPLMNDCTRWFCWRFFDMVSMVLLIGSWSYSREWVWYLRTKLCCTASGKWDISRVSLQGFDITYIIL